MMKSFKKILFSCVLIFLLVGLFSEAVFAQGVLPTGPEVTISGGCDKFINTNKNAYTNETEFKNLFKNQGGTLMGCAIQKGRVRLYMIPYFITYLVEFLLGIAGLVAVLFVIVGGYKYVVGGLVEDKEGGKKVIQNALIGLIVALSAWMVVNFIQIALTS